MARKDLQEKERWAINQLMKGKPKGKILAELGYKKSYIHTHTNDWWSRDKIVREVQTRRKLMAKRADIDADWIANRLKAIVELDVSQLVDDEGSPKMLAHLTPSLRKALNVKIKNGQVSISNDDRLKALDQLARVSGLYEEKIKFEGEMALTEKLLAGRKRANLEKEE